MRHGIGSSSLAQSPTGQEMAVHTIAYRHGVMNTVFHPTGEALPSLWALQDPDDYVEVSTLGVPALLRASGIDLHEVIGIGIDFTSCTVMPVTRDGWWLCVKPSCPIKAEPINIE